MPYLAILTKYLAWTTNRPTRIMAYTANGHKLIISRDSIPDKIDGKDLSDYDKHKYVAEQLQAKMSWQAPLVGGSTKEGYAFVRLAD